jgi:hypothetical protein
MIDDLTYSMKKPCIIDLKMGTREYSDHDSKKKQIQKVILSSVTASNALGFRICGMKTWKVKEKHFGTQSKKKALLLNTHQVEESLVAFIDNGKTIRTGIYKKALEKLNKIKEWFEEQTMYCFYASSILIIYDGESEDDNQEVLVKMIDFAHTQKSKKKKDDSYLFGLNHLTSTLQDIVDLKLQYKKGGKGCLTYPEIENITSSISSMQSNIDSIVARNANVGKNLDVKKRFELKLKEKDEVIEALRNELETLSEEMSKKMNHLELYAAMVESYETKLKIKDSIIEHLNFDLKQEEEKQIDPIIMEDNSTIKDQIISEKNSLIQSLMNFNEKLKKKNQILSNMNKDTLMYSKILTLQEEFDEIQHYREQELKEKEKELKEMEREMKKKEKEMMEWKQLLMEREQELKEKEIQLME